MTIDWDTDEVIKELSSLLCVLKTLLSVSAVGFVLEQVVKIIVGVNAVVVLVTVVEVAVLDVIVVF